MFRFTGSGKLQEDLDYVILLLVVGGIAFGSWWVLSTKITKQKVVVIQNLGVQLSSYNMRDEQLDSCFIDIARVRDVVINESLNYFRLDQYVSFICERES